MSNNLFKCDKCAVKADKVYRCVDEQWLCADCRDGKTPKKQTLEMRFDPFGAMGGGWGFLGNPAAPKVSP